MQSVPYTFSWGHGTGIIRCTPQVSLSPADLNPKDKKFSSQLGFLLPVCNLEFFGGPG